MDSRSDTAVRTSRCRPGVMTHAMKLDLHEVLQHHQTSLLAQLDMARSVFANAEAKGDATESEWIKVIEEFLPTRYQCSAAFVLDSNGDVSEFIDVVIHDR